MPPVNRTMKKDAPETLNGTVIEAVGHTGHTLLHACRLHFFVKSSTCILESPVTVNTNRIGHIGQPFQVGRIGMEVAAQVVFCHIL